MTNYHLCFTSFVSHSMPVRECNERHTNCQVVEMSFAIILCCLQRQSITQSHRNTLNKNHLLNLHKTLFGPNSIGHVSWLKYVDTHHCPGKCICRVPALCAAGALGIAFFQLRTIVKNEEFNRLIFMYMSRSRERDCVKSSCLSCKSSTGNVHRRTAST